MSLGSGSSATTMLEGNVHPAELRGPPARAHLPWEYKIRRSRVKPSQRVRGRFTDKAIDNTERCTRRRRDRVDLAGDAAAVDRRGCGLAFGGRADRGSLVHSPRQDCQGGEPSSSGPSSWRGEIGRACPHASTRVLARTPMVSTAVSNGSLSGPRLDDRAGDDPAPPVIVALREVVVRPDLSRYPVADGRSPPPGRWVQRVHRQARQREAAYVIDAAIVVQPR